jgi:hypothetical protein
MSDNPLFNTEGIVYNGSMSIVQSEAMPSVLPSIFPPTALSDGRQQFTATGLEGAYIQSSAIRINVYDNIPFAGGDGDYSILSVLHGPHSIGGGIFGFMTMKDSNKVRVQCVECRKAVMDFPWMDDDSRIKGSIKAWRAAFPAARTANVSGRFDLVDADFVHIRGDAQQVRLHTVIMCNCCEITDAAFVQLRGIHTLDMSCCYQKSITDSAFMHLRGIHTLILSDCDQVTITAAAFEHLRGIHKLTTIKCSVSVQAAAAALLQ